MHALKSDLAFATPAEPIVGLTVKAIHANIDGFISDVSQFPLMEVTTLAGNKFFTSIKGLRFRQSN